MNSQTTTSRVTAVLFAVLVVTSGFLAFIPMDTSAADTTNLTQTYNTTISGGAKEISVNQDNGYVYVGDSNGNLYRIAPDGSLDFDIAASTAYIEDVHYDEVSGAIYTADRNGDIKKFDKSGNEIWSISTGTEQATEITAYQDYVYTSSNNVVEKYDSSGNFVTSYTAFATVRGLEIGPNGHIYAASKNIEKLDTSLNPVYDKDLATNGGANEIVISDNDYAYITTNDGVEIRDDNGNLIELVDSPSPIGIDFDENGDYYIGVSGGDVQKRSGSDNSIIWQENIHSFTPYGIKFFENKLYTTSPDATVQSHTLDNYTPPSNTLIGTVVDEEDTPVSNATVEIYGVDHSQITAVTGQSLEERAQELLAEAKDPFPPSWQPDLSLLNFFDSAEEDYVAVHSANVLPDNRFFDWGENTGAADLDTPQLTVAADEPLVMTVWDPTAGDTLENAVDEDLPGKTTDGTIVVKKLSMSGEVLDTKEIETQEVYNTGVAPFSKTHDGVRLSLGQGFYEVSPEGSSNSYVIASVGDMSIEELGNTYATNLEDSANRLTDRATEIKSKLTSGEFGRIVVETDANGEFTAEVPSAFATVDVTAYKAGDFLSSVDLDQRSISELQKELEAAEYDGSIYVPTQTQTVSTPFPSTVNVEVKEVLSLPNTGGVDTTGAEDAVNKTINTTVTAAEDLLDPDTWDNATDETKKEIYNSLLRTVLGNDDLEACIIEGAEEAGLSSTYSWDSVDDETAEQQLEIMTTCIGTTTPVDTPEPDDIEGGAEEVLNGAGDVIDYVLNLRIPFAGSLNPDTASVIVRYADGSFETMGDDYWSVDEGILGTDAVVIEDYPLPSDQAMASVEILASDEDGVDKGSVEVRNPAFNGETPALQAIKLNTLAPGAGQSVQLDVSPTDDSSFKSVKSATVWDGDGNELSSTLNNGQLTFTAAGEGSHLVKLTVDDTDGNEYVERLRIGAQEDDLPYDPSIRVKKGFLGTYAVVGDGAIDGEISQRNDVTTVGVTLADGENPSAVRVHLNELDETDNIKVRLMQGSSQQSYDKFTTVFVYTNQLSEDSLVYRDGNQPISVDKGKYGVRMDKTDAELIVTYTDTDGTVDLGVNNDPSFVDRILFSVREQLGGISDGLSLGVILIPPVVLARRNGDSL
ncbi:hypothetical protein [Halorubrum ezzemoulense]|uniref:hypothetical protein n=1 Tax=Halorubrum ezzemoulense TaxID=337243 RepID=UPI00232C59CB|nr:hypothetical protein [Halorubrum ezzemoulense]MDB2237054.1 hypothetical protein [Halorubrum ezzemoulense]